MQGKRRLERQHTSAMPSCAALCAPATWVCVARMQPGQLAIRRFKLAGWPLLRPCRASALLHMDMAVKHDAELGMVRPASFGVHLTNNAEFFSLCSCLLGWWQLGAGCLRQQCEG